MLWLTLGSLITLTVGFCLIKSSAKLATLGIVLAMLGAALAVTMFVAVLKEDARNAAKCESVTGSYGGDVCYVSGVEKDLKEIGL